ncbi:MAG: electron transfer flavoprotein subunit alpha/FixB family protein [Chloroflexi bacterium]|nr:electron transfer flavoprotein subunit alpha/FixB family protein [Chloroflexota bacterium]
MAGIWVHGELSGDGRLAKVSTEVATLARALAAESPQAEVTGIVIGADPGPAAQELTAYLPRVLTLTEPVTKEHAAGMVVAQRLAALVAEHDPDVVLIGAGPEGRDLAGALSALTGRGILANALAVRSSPDGPIASHSVFGGKLLTESALTGGRGIVTVRANAVNAEPLAEPGTVEPVAATGTLDQPAVPIVERIASSGAAASIDDARIIVAGGRGVGGAEGFSLVQELAEALGGAVGATRAAVDSGWIPYSQQIGQTGKLVKPQLYLALGISGAIQHKVGMQGATTIVAVNRDPDAPIADFADMLVVGDLVEVGRALLGELRSRSG